MINTIETTAPHGLTAHRLQFDAPTWGDYRNGGYGDLVAQCACGQHEYVATREEGQYWHWLHRTNPAHRGYAILRLLVENPMPEGWAEPQQPAATPTSSTPAAGRYICPTCKGEGTIAPQGGFAGKFYAYGCAARAECPACKGSGRVDQWPDPANHQPA